MKKNIVKIFFTLLTVFLSIQNIFSKNIYADSVRFYDVNLAVSKALPGDIVFIPEGIASWGTPHNLVVNGGITIIGAGKDKTIIGRSQSSSNSLITFDGGNGLVSELYDIGFEGRLFPSDLKIGINGGIINVSLSQGVMFINGSQDFKISGCSFSGFGNCAVCIIDNRKSLTTQRGVIYNNIFINNYYSQVKNFGYGVVVYGDNTWPYATNNPRPEPELGTINAVYVEDNLFEGNRHHIASNNASKYVFRYNNVKHTKKVINYAMVDAHGASSAPNGEVPVGSLSYEIYNNTFSVSNLLSDGIAGRAIGIRGGDGVIFNNTLSNNIHRTIELMQEFGIICGESFPYETRSLYIWNNERPKTTLGIKITDEQGVVKKCDNFNYVVSKKPNYKPYQYPHPRRNLAFRKPTTSSSIDANHPSSYAVDGNFNKSQWWGANPYSKNPWWQVDLKQNFTIDKIIVTPYYDGIRYYHYNIQASRDNINWFEINNKTNNNLSNKNGDLYDNLPNINARYLRVNMTFNSLNPAVHLVEFEAYGKPTRRLNNSNKILRSNRVQKKFIIYPNPTDKKSSTSILINDIPNKSKVDFKLINLSGKILDSKILYKVNNVKEFNLDKLKYDPGVYFIVLRLNNGEVLKQSLIIK